MGTETVARKIEKGAWQKWWAWRPVKIDDQRIWLKSIYRRKITKFVDNEQWSYYQYGTIFNILADDIK